ncbi:conserved hypothetical protein [Roseibium sp. TrichSKD4]|uniref:heparin lyase I family protein n=1 Tax=Roseibium sp. TrichSKD4 TaxID=744980 RepID=UPI0001E56877|nr:heparin lyase I family protein [Roseibium sp. TrichSKD4]EFO32398.1 conserved hypothetical protein [Roseibium sp. TrichSKD4]
MARLILVLLFLLSPAQLLASDRTTLPNDVASGFGKSWLKSMPYGFKKHGFKIVTAPEPVRFGKQAIRFEVRPGDCGNSGDWDDCSNDRERHELSQINSLQRHGDTYWYAWSIYIPNDTPLLAPTKVHLGQFQQRKNNVLWLMSWNRSGYSIDNQVPGYGRTREMRAVVPSNDMKANTDIKGRWLDILVHVKWSHDTDGFFRVYANHDLKYDWKGQTIAQKDRSYFKFGIYRSFISRYSNSNNGAKPPKQIVYYDEVRRGKTLKKVDKVGVAAIQTILAENNHYSGQIDGLWGPGTLKGVNEYLKAKGASPVTDYSPDLWSAFGHSEK